MVGKDHRQLLGTRANWRENCSRERAMVYRQPGTKFQDPIWLGLFGSDIPLLDAGLREATRQALPGN